jgi:serine protease
LEIFMNSLSLARRLDGGAALWICIVVYLAAMDSGFAMEPTPAQPTKGPPDVITNENVPVTTHIIVKYVANESAKVSSQAAARNAAQSLADKVGVGIQHVRIMSGNAQVVEVVGVADLDSARALEQIESIARRIAEDPAVEYAEPDAIMRIQTNDPRFAEQWHYTTPGTGVNLVEGWSNSTGNGVVTAVIDTGYRPHADLVANLVLPGYDFINDTTTANDGDGRDADASDPGDWCPPWMPNSSWHGTHVAGTVAAVTNNTIGVAGVARNAKVLPVRVLGKCGGYLSDIVDGMRWAAALSVPGVPNNSNRAQVLNLSLGGSGSCGPAYQNAINDIISVGSTIVVAAGNSNSDASGFRPANCNGIITVAATNKAGARAYYSNFGSVVDISAPGGETNTVTTLGVLSTLNSGSTTPGSDSYAFYQGTSMAAPHVAGLAALLYQLWPGITPVELATRLFDTAQPFPTVSSNQCNNTDCGAGIVDAGKATHPDSQPAPVSMPWIKLLL